VSVAFDARDVFIGRSFRIAWKEIASEIHCLNVMLHTKIAHSKEVDALRGISDVRVELFKKRIRIQSRCEVRLTGTRERRVSRMGQSGSKRCQSGDLKKMTTIHRERQVDVGEI
jgi:hypothetical protein